MRVTNGQINIPSSVTASMREMCLGLYKTREAGNQKAFCRIWTLRKAPPLRGREAGQKPTQKSCPAQRHMRVCPVRQPLLCLSAHPLLSLLHSGSRLLFSHFRGCKENKRQIFLKSRGLLLSLELQKNVLPVGQHRGKVLAECRKTLQ